MPIYEYWCNSCKKRVSLLVRRMAAPLTPQCPHCRASDLARIISSFSVCRPEGAVYEDILSDTNLVRGLEQEDPRAVAEWSRKMSRAAGEDLGPEFDQMVDLP